MCDLGSNAFNICNLFSADINSSRMEDAVVVSSLDDLEERAEGGDVVAIREICRRARNLKREVDELKEDKLRLENYFKTIRYVKRAYTRMVERRAMASVHCSATHINLCLI